MVPPFRIISKSSEKGLVDDICQCWSDVSIRTKVHDSLCYQHSNRGYDPRPLNARDSDPLNNIAGFSFPVYEKVSHSIDDAKSPFHPLARIFQAFEMFIDKASGAPLYECYRKPLITQPMSISGAPAG
jgi:hypothetical protein